MIQSFPIKDAFCCVDCECVMDTAQVCPRCGSGVSIASLDAWLRRRSLQDVFQALNMASAVMAPKEARG